MSRAMRLLFVLACCLSLPLVSACGPTGGRVPLTYTVLGQPAGACTQPVGVYWFEDDRGSDSIGRNGEEELYPRSMAVSTWATDALVRELGARACKAQSLSEESPFVPDTTVHGQIKKLYLTRDDLKMTLDMALRITVERGGKQLLEKTYTGQWERTTAPTEEVFTEMYRQGLADLLQGVADDVAAQLR